MNNIDNWLRATVMQLTDAISVIERRIHHKEIDFDEHETHFRRYEDEAIAKLLAKIKEIEVEAKVAVLEQLTEGAGVSDNCCSVHLQAIELLTALKAQDTKGGEGK